MVEYAEYKKADQIEWCGQKASEMTREQLIAFVEQLNWVIADQHEKRQRQVANAP